MGKAEQTRGTKHAGPGVRRDEKRRLARLRRQAERKDPENAPGQVRELLKGWVD
jgi:hypothetical protein